LPLAGVKSKTLATFAIIKLIIILLMEGKMIVEYTIELCIIRHETSSDDYTTHEIEHRSGALGKPQTFTSPAEAVEVFNKCVVKKEEA
jgi:hypothetical protein